MLIPYLITDPALYTQDALIFKRRLEEAFTNHTPLMALYRDKENPDYARLASLFVEVCKEHGVKSIIHNDLVLASKLKADGLHFSANRLCSIGRHDTALYTIFSAHNENEIENAITLGVNAITYSPIFASPNKGEPVGVDQLRTIVDRYQEVIDVFALGGIVSSEQLQAVQKSGAKGFASIRYFTKH